MRKTRHRLIENQFQFANDSYVQYNGTLLNES
jgi:hypothetical protein